MIKMMTLNFTNIPTIINIHKLEYLVNYSNKYFVLLSILKYE